MNTATLAPQLAKQILKSVKASPKESVPVLMTLLKTGVVSPETPVGERGGPLVDQLLAMTLDEAQHKGAGGDLVHAVFGTKIKSWHEAGGEDFFSRRTLEDTWVPVQWLRTMAKGANRARPGSDPGRARLDAWFSTAIAPLDLTQLEANQVLAGALAIDLPETVDLVWDRANKLSLVNSKPVLAHARTADAWSRFLREGGDPEHPVGKQPLWRTIAASKPTQAPHLGLAGRVERWSWGWLGNGNGRDADRRWLEDSIDRRLAGKGKLGSADWLALLAATPFPGPRWEHGDGKTPAWETVARMNLDTEFLSMLSQGSLANRVDKDRLAHVRAEILPLKVVRASTSEEQLEAIEQWSQALNAHGHPDEAAPAILSFAGSGLGLDKKVVRRLSSIATAWPGRWWGTDGNKVGEQVLDLVLEKMTTGGQDSPGRRKGSAQTLSRLTQDRHNDPAVRVALGMVMMTWGSKDDEAMGLMNGSEALLNPRTSKGEERLGLIRVIGSNWNAARNERLNTFLRGAEMEVTLPEATAKGAAKVRI